MGKFSNCFGSSFDAVDLYPITPSYKLGGKSKFTSFLTFLVSFGIIIFILVLFLIELVDLIRHKNASILISEVTNNQENITIFSNTSTFQMAFGLLTTVRQNTFRYDPMQIVVASVRDGNSTYLNRTIISVEPCQPYHFKNVDYQEYEQLYCFRFEDINELFVSDLDHRALQVRFYHCNQTATQCPNNMDFFVKNTTFRGVYTAWSVNPMLHDTPLMPRFEVINAGILMGIHREFIINVNTIEFISDNGWLWGSKTSETITTLQSIEQNMYTFTQGESGFTFENGEGAAFLTIQFCRGGNKVIYQRSYKKIQDVFAEVTGLAEILIPIFGLLLIPYMPFARLKMYERTANELYVYVRVPKQDPSESNLEPEKLDLPKIELENSNEDAVVVAPERQGDERNISLDQDEGRQGNSFSVISLDRAIQEEIEKNAAAPNQGVAIAGVIDKSEKSEGKSSSEQRQDQTQVPENKEEVGKPVKVSFWTWLKSLCRHEPEVKVLSRTINHMEQSMDFITLMKNLVEIDKFKRCVLNEDQLALFNSMQKPVRSVDEEGNRDDLSHEEEEKSDDLQESSMTMRRKVKQAYENLKKKEVLTEFDRRLLEHYKKKFE